MATKFSYRILNANGTYLNAGTDNSSYFTLEQARKIVDYSKGQKIMWFIGGRQMAQTF